MARIETDPNYSAPTFSRATAATDLFKKEDVQNLAAAMSAHDHASTRGVLIGAGGIAPNAIDSSKIANGAVDSNKLASPSVITAHIYDANITNPKIAPGTITQDKLYNADFRTLGLAYVQNLRAEMAAPNAAQGAVQFGNAGVQLYWNGAAWVCTPGPPATQQVIYDAALSADYWSPTGLPSGGTAMPTMPVLVTVPASTLFLTVYVNASVYIQVTGAGQFVGFDVTVQNVTYKRMSRAFIPSAAVALFATYGGAVHIPPAAWGGGSGGRQIGINLWASAAVSTGVYFRPATSSLAEYFNMTVVATVGA